MYDFRYLTAPLDAAAVPVVYRYSSGALRRAILARVAQRVGEPLVKCSADELAALLVDEASLFAAPAHLVCDLREELPADLAVSIAIDLARERPRISALLLSEKNPLLGHSLWRTITARAVNLDEPRVSAGTVAPLLGFLAQTTDLASHPACIRQPAFARCFSDLVASEAPLSELVQRFDFLLASSDPSTNLVDVQEAILESSARRGLAGVDELLDVGGETEIVVLVANIVSFLRTGRSADALLRTIASRTMRRLHSRNKGRDVRAAIGNTHGDLLLAGLMVASWRELVPVAAGLAQETIAVRWDALFREFTTRRNWYDPLRGYWQALNDVLAGSRDDVRAPATLRRLIEAMLAASADIPLEVCPDWIARLRQNLLRSVVDSRLRDPRQKTGVARPLTAFDELVGQNAATQTLKLLLPRYRLPVDPTKEKDAGPPSLLLFGPDGVGKTALARLFTKALLCDQPAAGSPCNNCLQCKSYENGNALGDGGILDATRQDLEDILHEKVFEASQPSIAPRWVLIVDKVDQCNHGAFDTLLKTLEEHLARVVYILLARDSRGVGAAARSRCLEIELRPLGLAEARRLASRRLDECGKSDFRHRDEIAIATGGLPSRLLAALDEAVDSDDYAENGLNNHQYRSIDDILAFQSTHGEMISSEWSPEAVTQVARHLIARRSEDETEQRAQWDQVAAAFLRRGS